MIARFPRNTGAESAGTVKCSYVLRIPTTMPENAEQRHDREEPRAPRPTASALSCPGLPKMPMIHGMTRMKIAVSALSPSSISQKRVDATRHARACVSPLLEQLAEDGNERGRGAPRSATRRARTRFGSWNATVKALIFPVAPK